MTSYDTFTDSEKKQFREWLHSHLVCGPVTVTFVKKDGSERTMRCTLSESDVKTYEKKTERTKAVSDETCAVFDLDKQEWRSFRYDSVTNVKFSLGNE